MLNVTGKFVTVFQPTIKTDVSSKILFCNLSTSKKNTDKDGKVEYINMSWKAKMVGKAFEMAKEIKNGDKIDILKASIENTYDKEKQKAYFVVTIFEFEFSPKKSE